MGRGLLCNTNGGYWTDFKHSRERETAIGSGFSRSAIARRQLAAEAGEEMKDLTDMAIDELDELLCKLHADFQEVEEERLFVLGQTGVHISAATARKYEAEVNDLRTRIESVEKAIRAKKAEQA